MLGGRDGNHHPEAVTGRPGVWTAVLALVLWAVAGEPARADVQKIAPDGTVHRVDVEVFNTGQTGSGTRLRHTRQSPGGMTESTIVAGTDDPAVDREPSLDIDPVTGRPILVWSRNEGAGFDVVLSRYEGQGWAPFVRVTSGGGDESSPQVGSGNHLIHVLYRQGMSAQTSFYRSSFDRTSLAPVFGPELLPVDGMPFVPPEGESTPSSAPPPAADHVFFSAAVPGARPGDPGRILVWGVRDDPAPIVYRQGFLLPSDARSLEQHRAGWVSCRFALWYATADRFYYTSRVGGLWHEVRIVALSSTTTVADARLQLEEMIVKADDCAGP